jgi:hypothetical protein
MWNSIDRDWAVDHDFFGNAKEGVIVSGDRKTMVIFNDVLNRIDKGLLRMSVLINIFASKDKAYEVVVCLFILMKAKSAVRELTEGVGYDWMVVEELRHMR